MILLFFCFHIIPITSTIVNDPSNWLNPKSKSIDYFIERPDVDGAILSSISSQYVFVNELTYVTGCRVESIALDVLDANTKDDFKRLHCYDNNVWLNSIGLINGEDINEDNNYGPNWSTNSSFRDTDDWTYVCGDLCRQYNIAMLYQNITKRCYSFTRHSMDENGEFKCRLTQCTPVGVISQKANQYGFSSIDKYTFRTHNFNNGTIYPPNPKDRSAWVIGGCGLEDIFSQVLPTREPTTNPTTKPTTDPTSGPTTDPTSGPTLVPTAPKPTAPNEQCTICTSVIPECPSECESKCIVIPRTCYECSKAICKSNDVNTGNENTSGMSNEIIIIIVISIIIFIIFIIMVCSFLYCKKRKKFMNTFVKKKARVIT